MNKYILSIFLFAAVNSTACNNPAQSDKDASEKKDVKIKTPNHTDSNKRISDTLGMKMGGNELDSKKK